MKFIIILLFVLYTSIAPAAHDIEISSEYSECSPGSNFFVGEEVELGKNISIIGGPLYILGKSRIGNNCILYPFSVIQDCILEDGVTVHPHSVLNESTFKSKSKIGPFAYVSEGSVIGEEAVIGSFVQVKRSKIGARTKAQHITYLGDTETGEGVNIGGGTITCNYNGISKNKTIIEDNTFIGSNSTLVAPVTIGVGAYTAAGSTITENVPADSLAIARSKQTNKPGYASKVLAKFRALKDQK
jgi:bifunctional UDP-N-acetylglucosamine pyrophosphorylase/glucosamine-1-phosphate N-acetyltransferase